MIQLPSFFGVMSAATPSKVSGSEGCTQRWVQTCRVHTAQGREHQQSAIASWKPLLYKCQYVFQIHSMLYKMCSPHPKAFNPYFLSASRMYRRIRNASDLMANSESFPNTIPGIANFISLTVPAASWLVPGMDQGWIPTIT